MQYDVVGSDLSIVLTVHREHKHATHTHTEREIVGNSYNYHSCEKNHVRIKDCNAEDPASNNTINWNKKSGFYNNSTTHLIMLCS